jgi:hypothetical protein
MKETEFTRLIERQKAIKDANKYYQKQIELLTDMVNYASWLIPRARDSSGNTIQDDVVIGALYKHIITMVDSIEIHLSNGTILPGWLQARSAFEASIYINWVLMDESGKRAKYYYVADLHKRKLWALRHIKDTEENKKLKEMVATSELEKHLDFQTPELEEAAKDVLADIEMKLNSTYFGEVEQAFEDAKRKNKGREVDWYKPLGKTSIRAIAKELGRLPEYEYFYDMSSTIMHARDYTGQIMFLTDRVVYKPIRFLEDASSLIQWTGKIFFDSTVLIIKHYRSRESADFGKKYMRDWRDAYLNITSVKYKFPS